MTRQSSSNASSFCQNIISSLTPNFRVFASYFIGRNAVERKYGFDYKVLVVGPWYLDDSLPVYPISDAEELSFLECLLLREMLKPVEPSHSVVLGVRFSPRVNRRVGGKILSPLQVLLAKDTEFMECLLQGLALASPESPLFGANPPDFHAYPFEEMPPPTVPENLRAFSEPLRKREPLNDHWIFVMSRVLFRVIYGMGLGKLFTIPELDPMKRRRRSPLAREDASRIRLMQDLVHPRYNAKRTRYLTSIRADWTTIPARLFVYGPILDLVNTFQKRRLLKICWNCGRLSVPKKYKKKTQHYCNEICRKRAESKRRYLEKIGLRKKPRPKNN